MKRLNPKINRKNPISEENGDRLRQCLFQAWNSQIHLYQYHEMDDDYVAISVQWLPSMFYYTFYHCLQAYFAASGKPHTPKHSEALRVITGEFERFPAFMGARLGKQMEPLAMVFYRILFFLFFRSLADCFSSEKLERANHFFRQTANHR